PGSRTTRVNGAGLLARADEVSGRGVKRNCHQTNDATIRAKPNQATMFFIAPPKPDRPPDIFTFSGSGVVLLPPSFDNESRSCCRVRAQPLRSRTQRAARLDTCGSPPGRALP